MITKVFEDRILIWVVSDSTGAGANGNTGNGPTVSVNTGFYYSRGTNDLINEMNPDIFTAPSGSPYPKCLIDFRTARPDKRLLIIPSGVGGAYVSNNNGSANWSNSGAYYSAGVTDVRRTLGKLDKASLNFIFIASLGVNDATDAGLSAETINAAINNLIERLQSDFPGVPIMYEVIGVTAATQSQKITDVQNHIRNLGNLYNGVFITEGMSALDGLGYMADAKHPTQAGNNYRGGLFAQCLVNHLKK